MERSIPFTRRTFVADLGRGAFAVAILGVSACVPAASGTARPSGNDSSTADPLDSPEPTHSNDTSAARWERVNLGFVSAYILARAGEAAVVDTGVAGSEGAIGESLAGVGLGWAAVGHVILTHKHADHAGSAEAVMGLATGATLYAGAPDIPALPGSLSPEPIADDDVVFGLRIIATPGHTNGHVSVLDQAGTGILVAGDALNTSTGSLTGSSPQFTEDQTAATASVIKLGRLTFEALYVGHGEPILTGASTEVAALTP